jgi:hypothetical protein
MRVKRSSWHYKLAVSHHKYDGWAHPFDAHDDSRVFYIINVAFAIIQYLFSSSFRNFYKSGNNEHKKAVVFFGD